VFGYYVYKRLHLEAFLRECSRHFALAVWSSASDDYVEAVVARIMPRKSDSGSRGAGAGARTASTRCF
jgi:RNA polymerase II subunit A small phosphatase-like protein